MINLDDTTKPQDPVGTPTPATPEPVKEPEPVVETPETPAVPTPGETPTVPTPEPVVETPETPGTEKPPAA